MTTLAGTAGNDSDDQDTFKKLDTRIYKVDMAPDKENEGVNGKKGKSSVMNKSIKQNSSRAGKGAENRSLRKRIRSSLQILIQDTLENAAISHASLNCLAIGPKRPPAADFTSVVQGIEEICLREDKDHMNDIIAYMKEQEQPLAFDDLLGKQVEITPRVRAVLVDWLIQVQNFLDVGANTLHLSITLLDLCLSKSEVNLAEVQLLGITCLLIAAKFHERFAPEIARLIRLTDNTYTYRDVLLMEIKVLEVLGCMVNYPTAQDFLHVFLGIAGPDEQLLNVSQYLLDLSLVDQQCTGFKPSLRSAGAVYAAKRMINSANHAMLSSKANKLAAKTCGMERRPSRRMKMGQLPRQRSIELMGSSSRGMSCTVSETTSTRRISVVLDNGDGRSLSVTMDDDIAQGKRRVSITAMDCDEDVFTCQSTFWNNQLNFCPEYSEEKLIPVANRLTELLVEMDTSQFQGAKNKYARQKFNRISKWAGLEKSALLPLIAPQSICAEESGEVMEMEESSAQRS